ncbi:MAG: hypothetical protein DRP51_10290 [Candidatus Zixiibacteriota bacterium]|nr:MAG: hypothetical protein DRP51_10290 [candidate division Zixibacteria bacterium]
MAKIPETAQKKWSDDMLRQFYAELLKRFGPHKNWYRDTYPSIRLKDDFEKFMKNFTDVFHVAPKSQLAWGVTHQDKIGLDKHGKPQDYNQRNYMRNRLAAFDTKFIDKEYFADELLFKGHYPVHGMRIAELNSKIEEANKEAAGEEDFTI